MPDFRELPATGNESETTRHRTLGTKPSPEEMGDFFEISLDPLAIASLDGYFVRVNSMWKEVLGYEISQLQGKRFLDLIHPEDQASTMAAMRTLATGKPVLNFTNRYRAANGEYRFIEWRSTQCNGLIYAAARDVTNKNQILRDLVAERNRLSLFVEHAQAAVAMLDKDMRYLAVSRKWMLEYRLDGWQVIGKTHYEVFPNIPQRWKDIHARCLQGAVERNEHDIWRPEGWEHDQHLIWEVRPWYDINQSIGGLMMFTRDITVIKQTEAELARAKEKIAAMEVEAQHLRELLAQTELLGEVGYWEVDLTTQKVNMSPHSRAIHGVSADYVPSLDRGLAFYQEGEARDSVASNISRTLMTGESWEATVPLIRTDGELRQVKLTARGDIRDGVCKRLYGAIKDITDK